MFTRATDLLVLVLFGLEFALFGLLLGLQLTPPKNHAESVTMIVEEQQTSQPLIAVVPHHNLVMTQRQQFLSSLSKTAQPQTIIVLSPNHFEVGENNILTTDQVWSVQGGEASIQPNLELIQTLTENAPVEIESAPFLNEHGIKNLLPEIHAYFPSAKLVPLIFKEGVTQTEVMQTADTLFRTCQDCGVVASVDMSHYQPAHVAEIHDIKTIRALSTQNEQEIWDVEVDSNPSLAFLVYWAKAQGANRFTLADHTNSGLLTNNLEVGTTTHLFGYYQAGESLVPEDTFTFTIAGDGMFGRFIGSSYQEHFEDLFSQLGNRTFWGTDVSLMNLEGPVSDQGVAQDPQAEDLSFLFSKHTTNALTFLKLTHVGLANNHTFNQGALGFSTTQHVLDGVGIGWFGHPNQVGETSVKRFSQGQLHISMVAISAFGDMTGLEDLIRTEKSSGAWVIVLPHWGTEYQTTHSSQQEELARAWSEAGADMIIGAHPHVVQDAQVMNQTLVLYSLGNFVFDQTFSTDTQQGLIVTGLISQAGVQIVLTPIESVDLQPRLLKGENRQLLLERICGAIQDWCVKDTVLIPVAS